MLQTSINDYFGYPKLIESPNHLICFTDGSTINNGSKEARGGYAVIWPFLSSYNIGMPLYPSTNNRAEYHGVILAIQQANQIDPTFSKTLIIYTDSMLIVNSITKWLPNWKKNNYMKSDGKPVLNQDLIKQISEYMVNRKLIFRHVSAHTHSKETIYLFNDLADGIAKRANFENRIIPAEEIKKIEISDKD